MDREKLLRTREVAQGLKPELKVSINREEFIALIDLALKGLDASDEWNYNTDTAPESFLGLIKGCETGRLKQAVIDRSDAEDADWLVAGDELSNAWDVIAWQSLPTPPKDTGGE